MVRSASTGSRARPPNALIPISGYDHPIAYRDAQVRDENHLRLTRNIYRCELEAPWIPPGAQTYIDERDPPDECFWVADIALNRSLRQERVNADLHGLERILWDSIAHSLDTFQDHVYEADAIMDFRENLKHAAHEAMDAARKRFDQYAKCASVRSNNRGRYLQLRADEHIAHGLLLLARIVMKMSLSS